MFKQTRACQDKKPTDNSLFFGRGFGVPSKFPFTAQPNVLPPPIPAAVPGQPPARATRNAPRRSNDGRPCRWPRPSGGPGTYTNGGSSVQPAATHPPERGPAIHRTGTGFRQTCPPWTSGRGTTRPTPGRGRSRSSPPGRGTGGRGRPPRRARVSQRSSRRRSTM